MTNAQPMLIRYSFNAVVIGIVFFSIIIHEVSHAWVANWLGDDTAKRQNRLSLNPLKHVDPFGTVILPILLYLTAGFVFGYAKPVPINPYNFRDFKRDSGLVALAGPVSNILIAVLFALVYHLSPEMILIKSLAFTVILMNLLLAFFNLIPVPPLDGSKVLGMFLGDQAYYKWTMQERKGMMILVAILIGSQILGINIVGRLVVPIVYWFMRLMGIAI